MKMALDNASHANLIRSCSPGQVEIRDRAYTASLIVSAEQIVADWEPRSVGELRPGHLDALTRDPPEVVILGTGDRQVFPDPAALTTLMDLGIGFEVMDNRAACRTYNVLLSEHRRVTLALIIDGAP